LPNVLDRAIRVAETQRAPTAVIIPLDVQEAEYSPPTHDFKMVPSSLGYSPAATVLPDEEALDRAAAVLHEGSKAAILAAGDAPARPSRWTCRWPSPARPRTPSRWCPPVSATHRLRLCSPTRRRSTEPQRCSTRDRRSPSSPAPARARPPAS